LSFWNRILNGSFVIQFTRLFIYGIPFLIISILILLGLVAFSEWRDKRKKVKAVNLFKSYHQQRITDKDQIMFNTYLKKGKAQLVEFSKFLSSERRINFTYNLLKNPNWEMQLKEMIKMKKSQGINLSFRRIYERRKHRAYLYRRLIEIGILIQNNDGPQVDESKKALLDDFLSFINRQKGLPPDNSIRIYKDHFEEME
jgi:hypothetical protein